MAREPHEHEYDEATAKARSVWRGYLTGDGGERYATFTQVMRTLFSRLPSEPRCKICRAPFRGVGSVLARQFGFGAGNWQMNPRLCDRCEVYVRKHEVGVETQVTLLFADIRGSTQLAERLGPEEFRRLIDRFYRAATSVLIESDALIEKLIGDEVAGIYVPGIAGPQYTQRAVLAAQDLLAAAGYAPGETPWVEIGAGVHSGTAYVGAVGSGASMSVITVLGEAANTAARLGSSAAAGELLVSESTCREAGLDLEDCEPRALDLRGVGAPVNVRVLRPALTRVSASPSSPR
jgi:adenylate cyclase